MNGDGTSAAPGARSDQTLCDMVAALRGGASTPAIVAVRKEGIETWCYGHLARQIDELAQGLAATGIGPGERVALFAAHSPEWIVVALATILCGATLVPIDPQSDPRALTHIVEDSGVRVWFTSAQSDNRLRDRNTTGFTICRLDRPIGSPDSWHRLKASPSKPLPRPSPDDIAVQFYTSGTTGLPKGVPLTHRNLLFQVQTLRRFDLSKATERVLLALPLHHVYPFSIGLLGTLAYRGAIVIPQALTGPEILRAIRGCDVETILGVPRLFEVFVTGIRSRVQTRGRIQAFLFSNMLRATIAVRRLCGIRLGRALYRRLLRDIGTSLRVVVSGGAALDVDLARTMDALGWDISTGYGLTETAPLLALLPPGDTHFDSVGKPVPGTEIRIAPIKVDEDIESDATASGNFGAPPDNVVGEIQACGPGVFTGYHNLPDKTAAAFTPDGWFRTEDLGYLDKQGYLRIIGRHSTLIVTPAGENLQPDLIEAAFAESPAIREAGVLQSNGDLVAVIVPDMKFLRSQGRPDPEEPMREAILATHRKIPSHHRLVRYVISRDALPRTRLGKIRRADLQSRFSAIEAGTAGRERPGAEPLSDEDKALLDEPAARAVWTWLQERFADRALRPDASLALDLGVDSLEWINLTLEIRQRTGIEISEAATARIETLRDLLTEAVAAESSDVAMTAASLADDPEGFISPDQARWLRPHSRGEDIAAHLFYRLNRRVMRSLFHLKVSGQENLPEHGNFILAPSHASVLDPFVVAAAIDFDRLRRTYWAGWTGMAFANPLFRLVSRLALALPIELDQAAFSSLALSLITLKRGNNLIWFPEGGRSPDGKLQPFMTGIALLLERKPVPVVPAYIEGTFEAMPIGRRFPRFRPLHITIGKASSAEGLERLGHGNTRHQRITSGLREAVHALSRQPLST